LPSDRLLTPSFSMTHAKKPSNPCIYLGKKPIPTPILFFLLLTFGGKWVKFRPDLNSQKVQIPFPQSVNI
jgi:hypothetical protein